MSDLVTLNQFSVLKLTGPDATSFLQGQVTCDVTLLESKSFVPGCHCNAKGKMWSTFLAFAQDDAIYLIMTKASAAISLAELNKYGVFAKAEIGDDSDNWHLYGATSAQSDTIALELADQHYLVVSQQPLEASTDDRHWWKTELLSGRAHLFAETSGEYVPQMLNLQALDYISFNKGCYMGQEMVARMRYLGKNKRALYIAKLDGETALESGTDVYKAVNTNRRAAGKIINSCVTAGETYVQLVLPKDTELVDTIYLNQDDDTALQLLPLPYSLEQAEG
mgnify:CR=1 FL=1